MPILFVEISDETHTQLRDIATRQHRPLQEVVHHTLEFYARYTTATAQPQGQRRAVQPEAPPPQAWEHAMRAEWLKAERAKAPALSFWQQILRYLKVVSK